MDLLHPQRTMILLKIAPSRSLLRGVEAVEAATDCSIGIFGLKIHRQLGNISPTAGFRN